MNPIIKRILSLKGNQTSKAFAEEMGVSPSTFHYYEKGRMPPINFIMTVAERRAVNADWIIHGRENPNPKIREKIMENAAASGIVVSPKLQVITSAEYKEMASSKKDKLFTAVPLVEAAEVKPDGVKPKNVKHFMMVSPSWCQRPEDIVCIWVRGDSMNPPLSDGSIASLNMRKRNHEELVNCICLFLHSGYSKIARLGLTKQMDIFGYPINPVESKTFLLNQKKGDCVLGKIEWYMGKV